MLSLHYEGWRKGRESNSQGLRSSVFKTGSVANRITFPWCPRRESNADFNLRRVMSCPLDHEDMEPLMGIAPMILSYQDSVLLLALKRLAATEGFEPPTNTFEACHSVP